MVNNGVRLQYALRTPSMRESKNQQTRASNSRTNKAPAMLSAYDAHPGWTDKDINKA